MPASASDASLWHECFAQSYQQLLQVLTRYTGNADDARDLAQDLWLRLPPVGVQATNPQAYLFGMARNLALDHLRSQGREQSNLDALHLVGNIQGNTPDHAQQHLQRDLLKDIDDALAGLPARARDAFMRHQVHGESLSEVAARHGVSPPTIVRDLARAQERIDAVVQRWTPAQAAPNAPASAATSAARPDDTLPSDDTASAAQQRQERRRVLLSSLLSVVGLAGSGTLTWQLWRYLIPHEQYVLASNAAQRLAPHRLPDGSTLTLDAASRASVAYYAGRRTIQLQRGAAHFDVARDAGRPFTVRAEGVQVRVLGTRFSVDIQPVINAIHADAASTSARAAIEIAVASGLVRVESLAPANSARNQWHFAPLELQAGQHIRLYAAASDHDASVIEPLDTAAGDADEADWRNGRLNFHNAPLGRIIPRLQRYSQRQFRLDPRAAALPVTARIHIDEAEQWLRLLPRILPVQVSVRPGSVAIVAR